MSTTNTVFGEDLRQTYGDTPGDRPTAPQYEGHRWWTRSTQQGWLGVNEAGTLVWRADSGSGGPASKYWVNPAGKSPSAPYNTVQAGIDAANADWLAEGQTGFRDVFVLPGATYVENVTLKAGVNLIGLQGERNSPPLIQGSITNDVALSQISTVRGIAATNGFIAAGGKAILIEFDECLFRSNAGSAGFLDSNSSVDSVFTFRDCTISTNDAVTHGLDMGSTGSLLCERCVIGERVDGKALRVAAAGATFRACQFMGTRTLLAGATSTLCFDCEFQTDVNTSAVVQTAGSVLTIQDCRELGLLEPIFSGTGTLNREGVNVFKSASLSVSTITEGGSGAAVVHRVTKFSGVGPHTMNAVARTYLFLPGGSGALAALNLLNTSNVADHVPVTFINRDPAGSFVSLAADAGDTIGGAATLKFKYALTLIPDRATATWFQESIPETQNATVPAAYPYTTLDRNDEIGVNATAAPRSIVLADGTTEIEQVIIDSSDISATNNITVGVTAGKKMNGILNGTTIISTNGAMRGFKRDSAGQWRGGV